MKQNVYNSSYEILNAAEKKPGRRIAVISRKKEPSNKPENMVWLQIKDDGSMEEMVRIARRMAPDEICVDKEGFLWRATEWTDDITCPNRYAVQMLGNEGIYYTDPGNGEMLMFPTWEEAMDCAGSLNRKNLHMVEECSRKESRGYYLRRVQEIGERVSAYYDSHSVSVSDDKILERIDYYMNQNSARSGRIPLPVKAAMRQALFDMIRTGEPLTLPDNLFSDDEAPKVLKQPGTDREIDQVGVRLVRERTIYSEKPIHSQKEVVELLGREIASYDREVVALIHLDTASHPLSVTVCSMGTINNSLVCPREMFKTAILSNAAYIIMLHNHPSGSVAPSSDDENITQRMATLCSMMSIPLTDHIIVAPNQYKFLGFDYYSFKEHEKLPEGDAEFKFSDGRITWTEQSDSETRKMVR